MRLFRRQWIPDCSGGGVLRAGDQPWKRVCFRLFDGDVSALVVVPQLSSKEARQLVGATVRVRGVAGVHIDDRGRVVGAMIFVNHLEDIEADGAKLNPNTLAVLVNKGNPANDLTLAELRRILLGERTYWKGSRKIIVLLPTVGTPERQTTLRLVSMMNRITNSIGRIKRVVAEAVLRQRLRPVVLQ